MDSVSRKPPDETHVLRSGECLSPFPLVAVAACFSDKPATTLQGPLKYYILKG